MRSGHGQQGADVGMEIPEVDTAPLPAPDQASSLVEPGASALSRLAGAWEQIDVESSNDPDFAPGGYCSSVIAIRGPSGEMLVYRGFGPPAAKAALLISGQFSIDMRPDGAAIVAPSRLKPTLFAAEPREIPLADGSFVRMLPPRAAHLSTQWDTETIEDTALLVLDGKRYRRAPEQVYESIVHGNPAAVGEALDRLIVDASRASSTSSAAGNATSGAGGTPSTSVDFFGTRIRGRYIAFVIDNSGSMAAAGKLPAAIAELRRTIAALPPDANVYVVFFNSDAYELQGYGNWVRVGSPSRARLLAALSGVGADGSTNPEPALRRAFALPVRPDEVFLMTDGLMPPDVPSVIVALNGQSRARTRVHTYAFGPDADQRTLAEIARANDGQFRALP